MPGTFTNQFRAKPGTPVTSQKARVYGPELLRIARKYQGNVKTEDIVNEASNPNSPIHDFFNWDIKSAAHSWWKQQARVLENSVEIGVKFPNGTMVYVDVFESVRVQVNVKYNNEEPKNGKTQTKQQTVHVTYKDLSTDRDQSYQLAEHQIKSAIEYLNEFVKLVQISTKINNATKVHKMASSMITQANNILNLI